MEDRAALAMEGPSFQSRRLYSGDDFHVNYNGPDPSQVERFVMTFPDLIHPTGPDAPGWGAAFLRKRGAAVISLTFERANWFQSEGFFPAIEAARDFVGGRAPISAYGASMGGYGAILAGRRLGAERVVAVSPQFTIEPSIAPFEHRYRVKAAEIGPFIHDVSNEIRDEISYFVMHDSTHQNDRRHANLFPRSAKWHDLVQPGSGHGLLATLVQAGGTDALYRLIMGTGDHLQLRRAMRAGRGNSPRYVRRMGEFCIALPRRTKSAQVMIEKADRLGMKRLVARWRGSLDERRAATPWLVKGRLKQVVLHVGLPDAEAAVLQAHMVENRRAYRDQGMDYAGDLAEGGAYPPNHRWLSATLLAGDMGRLRGVREAAVDAPRLMLSDENLFLEMPYIRRVAFRQFRELFSDLRVRVLACTRDKIEWKRSFYKSSLVLRGRPRLRSVAEHWGHSDGFAEFFERPVVARLADWDEAFEDIRRHLGAEAVEKVVIQPGRDGVEEVLGHLGLRPVAGESSARGTPGLTDLDAEILRQANAQGPVLRGAVRILLGLPQVTEGPVEIKPRLLRKFRSLADDLDWSALRYRENPPLVYDREAFERRLDALREMAAQLFARSDGA